MHYRTSSPLGLLPKREANSSKTPGGDQNFIFAVGSPQANDTISICVGFQLVPVVSHRIITGFFSNSLKNLTLFFLKTGGNQIFFDSSRSSLQVVFSRFQPNPASYVTNFAK